MNQLYVTSLATQMLKDRYTCSYPLKGSAELDYAKSNELDEQWKQVNFAVQMYIGQSC